MVNVSPVFKTKDEFRKENYRPISVLCVFSKIFESVLNGQLLKYFDNILSILLSVFCKMYSCQAVRLKMVEDWKNALDNYQHTCIIVIDLSKALDSISHRYLMKKTGKMQRVKIGNKYSTWEDIKCGVPQGSIPDLFNLFINDIFEVPDKTESKYSMCRILHMHINYITIEIICHYGDKSPSCQSRVVIG